MVCSVCATEIPKGQPFCPACYASPEWNPIPQENRRQQNVIILMDSPLTELYHNWVLKYLQPDRVGWSFYALTKEAFVETTASSSGQWDLLILDPARARDNADLLLDFTNRNPGLRSGRTALTRCSCL